MTPATSPSRKPLTQDRIVTAALRMVDRRGFDALTMRGVGAALGYEGMALYKHVAGKQALIDLVVERVTAEIQPPQPTAPWAERLRHLAHQWRQMALAHPHVFPLLATAPSPSPASLIPVEATLAALRDATVDDDATVGYFRAFLAYVTGALIAECAAKIGTDPPPGSIRDRIDPELLPHLAALGPALDACDYAIEYERGLEILIASVETHTA